MKKEGFSLIEIIVTMAIIGIVLLTITPLITVFLGVEGRLYNQSKVDSQLNEVIDFIKRDVKNARETPELGGKPLAVYIDNNKVDKEGDVGNKVIINGLDKDGNRKLIEYSLIEDSLVINEKSSILSDVEVAEFKYKDNILMFYLKIKVPKHLEGKVKNQATDIGIVTSNQNQH